MKKTLLGPEHQENGHKKKQKEIETSEKQEPRIALMAQMGKEFVLSV